MMESRCENCMFEYLCDWKPAGDEDACGRWVNEGKVADGKESKC